MRIALVTALLLLAGCTDSEGEPTATDDSDTGTVEDDNFTLVLPSPISSSGLGPVGLEWDCTQPCPTFPFVLNGATRVTVDLSWLVPANDIDLVIEKNGEWVGESLASAPGSSEKIEVQLGEGQYRIIILPYNNAPDQWTLSATFAAPA